MKHEIDDVNVEEDDGDGVRTCEQQGLCLSHLLLGRQVHKGNANLSNDFGIIIIFLS